jgi:hypothetical protein
VDYSWGFKMNGFKMVCGKNPLRLDFKNNFIKVAAIFYFIFYLFLNHYKILFLKSIQTRPVMPKVNKKMATSGIIQVPKQQLSEEERQTKIKRGEAIAKHLPRMHELIRQARSALEELQEIDIRMMGESRTTFSFFEYSGVRSVSLNKAIDSVESVDYEISVMSEF